MTAHTREQLDAMNVIAPELEEALKHRKFPEKSPDMFEYRAIRAKHLSALRHMMPIPGPIPQHVTEKEVFVSARDGYSIKTIVYTPANDQTSFGPLIILVHEGGFVMGDLTDEEFNARLLTRDLGATCVNVEYRLAPEHPFPIGIQDCWDVVQWAASHAAPSSSAVIPADPSKGFIVGGSSAGGNFTAVLAHLSRNSGLNPPITGQWLSVPYTMDISQVPEKYRAQFISHEENDHDPILGHLEAASTSPLFDAVKPDMNSPFFSPMAKENYPDDKSKPPLARAFFQVSGLDPLRDHGLVYAQMLEEEYGVDTKVQIYPGYSHMFWTNWPELEASRQFSKDMVEGFRWLLKQ